MALLHPRISTKGPQGWYVPRAPKPWRREGRIVGVKFLASRNKFTLKVESIVFVSQSGPGDGSFAILVWLS